MNICWKLRKTSCRGEDDNKNCIVDIRNGELVPHFSCWFLFTVLKPRTRLNRQAAVKVGSEDGGKSAALQESDCKACFVLRPCYTQTSVRIDVTVRM